MRAVLGVDTSCYTTSAALVTLDGRLIAAHRRLLEVGAHCRPYNRCSIGICYEGGLSADGKPCDTRTKEQREQLLLLLMKLRKLFPDALIRGHSEMPGATPKACPCFNASAEFRWLQ